MGCSLDDVFGAADALKDFTDPTSANFKNVDAVVAILNDNYALLHP
jgi:hypothetical protein